MTVKGSIIKIRKYPEEMRVIIEGYEELILMEKHKK